MFIHPRQHLRPGKGYIGWEPDPRKGSIQCLSILASICGLERGTSAGQPDSLKGSNLVLIRVHQQKTLVHPSIFPFLDVIGDGFLAVFPYMLMAVLGHFLIFSPKKQIFKSKSPTKLKVQKWCSNGSISIS